MAILNLATANRDVVKTPATPLIKPDNVNNNNFILSTFIPEYFAVTGLVPIKYNCLPYIVELKIKPTTIAKTVNIITIVYSYKPRRVSS